MLVVLFSLPMGSFNSRSREGSDLHPSPESYQERGFNSRSREGSDGIWRPCP